jgi:ankyrin repeat protein
LFYAAAHGHAQVVELLLSAGADPSTPMSKSKWTAIFVAAGNGHIATVQLLLASGASPATVTAVRAMQTHSLKAFVSFWLRFEEGRECRCVGAHVCCHNPNRNPKHHP